MTPRRDADRDPDRALRDFFAAAHADDRPPPFERVAGPRQTPSVARRDRAWRPAAAVLAVLLIAIAAGRWMPRLGGPGAASLSETEQLALARELSSPESWRGPLDFLLDTPSREVLLALPSVELTTLKIPPPAGEKENEP